ncbi:hypothetical protein PGTUg99_002311 [Puccinia graminis f. sp. tritici]|uniref:Uncharacterized protein n=1 Tax=Puccinia graminis f. sp. tritici TaxID=56615 RepID=A0A5B0PCC7_PUCGR|nr:hypothetical protein PGTUg99_002311 [Puccinia graminis f. sp. tritici]
MEAPTVLNRLSRMPTDTQAFFNNGAGCAQRTSSPTTSLVSIGRPDGHASCDGYGMRIAPGPPAGCRQWPSQYALGLMKGTAKLDSGSADQLILARYTFRTLGRRSFLHHQQIFHSTYIQRPIGSSSSAHKPRHILHARLIQYTHPLLVLYISWIFRTCVGEVHAGIKVFCSAVILQNPSSDFNDLLFIGHHLQKVLNGLLQTSNTYFSRLLEPSIHLSTLACRLRQSAFSRRKQAAKEKTFDSITL